MMEKPERTSRTFTPQWPWTRGCMVDEHTMMYAVGTRVFRITLEPFRAEEIHLPAEASEEGDEIVCVDYAQNGDKEYIALGMQKRRGLVVELGGRVLDTLPLKKACVQCRVGCNLGGAPGPSAVFSERWGGVGWTGLKQDRTPSIKGLYREKPSEAASEAAPEVKDYAISAHVSAPIWLDVAGDGLVTVTYSDGVIKAFHLRAPSDILHLWTCEGTLRGFTHMQDDESQLLHFGLGAVPGQTHVGTYRACPSDAVRLITLQDGALRVGTVGSGGVEYDGETLDVPAPLRSEGALKGMLLHADTACMFTDDDMYLGSLREHGIKRVEGYSEWLRSVHSVQ